ATLAPSAANFKATARPIPRLAPVTRATLPSRYPKTTPPPDGCFRDAASPHPYADRLEARTTREKPANRSPRQENPGENRILTCYCDSLAFSLSIRRQEDAKADVPFPRKT